LAAAMVFIGTGFLACDRDRNVPTFDGESAYQYLLRQCEFGPRVPGSEAHRACQQYLAAELRRYGAQVTLQTFNQRLPLMGKTAELTNIIASYGLENQQRILLCAHWDSRPKADQDSSAANRARPVPGANDGASGVAVLLEVAHAVSRSEPAYGVDIILFDGEDSGVSAEPGSYALGAQYFASHKDARYRPRFAILLDMVGDKDLQLYQEQNSLNYAAAVVAKVWQRARELQLAAFVPRPKYQVTDDHLPLLRAGIQCIDIIDFDYPHWHTVSDTPDKCSPESLRQVGQLMLSLIYRE